VLNGQREANEAAARAAPLPRPLLHSLAILPLFPSPTGTFYNEQYKVPVINTPPWPQATEADLQNIVAIWRGVAETYALFDVDVTTDVTVTSIAGTYGTKVCMGGAPTDCELEWSCVCVCFVCVVRVACARLAHK
jgi:hypothetical protein